MLIVRFWKWFPTTDDDGDDNDPGFANTTSEHVKLHTILFYYTIAAKCIHQLPFIFV